MTSLIYPGLTFYRGTFSLFIAPSSLLAEALNNYLAKEFRDVLIISGEMPLILSRIRPGNFGLKTEKVSSGTEVYEALQKARESLILIEHDPAFYDYDADVIRAISLLSRKKVTRNQSIFLLGTRLDTWLNQFELYVHKMSYIDGIFKDIREDTSQPEIKTNQSSLNAFIKNEAAAS